MNYQIDLTNGMSGPAAEMEASMVPLRVSILSTHAALKSFDASGSKSAAQIASITAKGNQARILAETKASAQISAINAKGAQARALAESKAGAGLLAAREKMAGADLAQRNKAVAALIMLQAKGDAKVASAAKGTAAKPAGAKDKAEKNKVEKSKVEKKAKPPTVKSSKDDSKSTDMLKLAGKAAGAILAAVAVAGAGLSLTVPLALGYKGMAKMQMISAKLSLDIRKLFSSVDPSKFIVAVEKLASSFSKNTSTGRVMGDIIGRVFNGLFSIFEKLQPYITAFGQGVIYSFLLLENASLKARIQLIPLTSSLSGLFEQATLCKIIFYGVAAAVGMVAVSIGLLSIPIIFFVSMVTAAIKLYDKLKSLITGGDTVAKKAPGKKISISATADSAGKDAGPGKEAAGVAGQTSGLAMGNGLIKGIEAKLAAAFGAGQALGKSADDGVKSAAEIKSPSRKMRRSGGYMGQGLALGLKDSEASVQKAAANSLVPDLGKPSSTAPKAAKQGGDAAALTINFNGPVGGAVADFEAAVRRALTVEVRDAAMALGVKV